MSAAPFAFTVRGGSRQMGPKTCALLALVIQQPGIQSGTAAAVLRRNALDTRKTLNALRTSGWLYIERLRDQVNTVGYHPSSMALERLRVVALPPDQAIALQEDGAAAGTPAKPAPYRGQVVPPRTINIFQDAPPPSRLSGPYIRPGSLRSAEHPSVWCGQRVAPTVRLTAAQGGQE